MLQSEERKRSWILLGSVLGKVVARSRCFGEKEEDSQVTAKKRGLGSRKGDADWEKKEGKKQNILSGSCCEGMKPWSVQG